MIAIGNTKITKAYLGSTELKNIAIGDELLLSKASPYDEYGYIAAGKVFHVDGINKGNDSTKWTDIVGGYTFPYNTHTTLADNGVVFDGKKGSYIVSETNLNANTWKPDVCTIECVFDITSGRCHFSSGENTNIIFSIGNDVFVFYPSSSSNKAWTTTCITGKNTVSLSDDYGYQNGTSLVATTSDSWNQGSKKMSLGGRSYGSANSIIGTLHCVRIYNRKLTVAEILNNQQVDNTRFNLGLTI